MGSGENGVCEAGEPFCLFGGLVCVFLGNFWSFLEEEGEEGPLSLFPYLRYLFVVVIFIFIFFWRRRMGGREGVGNRGFWVF